MRQRAAFLSISFFRKAERQSCEQHFVVAFARAHISRIRFACLDVKRPFGGACQTLWKEGTVVDKSYWIVKGAPAAAMGAGKAQRKLQPISIKHFPMSSMQGKPSDNTTTPMTACDPCAIPKMSHLCASKGIGRQVCNALIFCLQTA